METKNLGKVCFILCGGGSKGATQVGQMKALVENNIIPNYVIGISVGALNGAKIVELAEKEKFLKNVEALENIWLKYILSRSKIYFLNNPIKIARRKSISLFNPLPLTELISKNLDAESIIKSNVRFDVIVSTTTSSKEIIFSNSGDEACKKLTKENFAKSILASASIPGLFPPVKIDDEMYFDGALTAPLPVYLPAKAGYDSVFILSADPPPSKVKKESKIHNWVDGLVISNEMSRDKLRLMDLNWTRNVNKNLKALKNLYGAIMELAEKEIPEKSELFKNVLDEKIKEFRFIQKRRIEIYYMYPNQLPTTLKAFDFDTEDIKIAINEGYQSAIKNLEEFNLI